MTPTQALTPQALAESAQRLLTSYGNAMYRQDADLAEQIAGRFSLVLAALSAAPAEPTALAARLLEHAAIHDAETSHYSDEQARWAADLREAAALLSAAPAPAEPAPVPAEWLKAVQEAYGWLWNSKNESMAPIPLLPEGKAAYQARKALRDLLTSAQRGEAINAVRGTIENMLAAAPASPKG